MRVSRRMMVPVTALALLLTACSTEGPAEQPDATESAPPSVSGISAERCALNEAAGTLVYMTGYYYQASVSILEFLAADALGIFEDLCLDIEIQPGTGGTQQNAQLLASGQVSFAAISALNLIQAQDNGIDVLGVSSLSNVGVEILMTRPEITDLTQLDGTILGHKGNLPPAVAAMIDEAGADIDQIQQVQVGYDPSVLPRGQVDSLTGFVSNEPNLLAAMGEEVTVWRPYDFGVPSTLGAMAVNPTVAAEHPTAVEDFLRAGLYAFEYCLDNGPECVGFAAELNGQGYDEAHNLKIWETESQIVLESRPAGWPLGAIDAENLEAIIALVNAYDLVSAPLDTDDGLAYFDDTFIAAIYDGDQLIWPAP